MQRDRRLRDHGQEEADAVALADAQSDEARGDALHLGAEFAKCDLTPRAGVALVDDCDALRRPRVGGMALDTMGCHVEPSAVEPAREGVAARDVDVTRPRGGEGHAEIVERGPPEPVGLVDRIPVQSLERTVAPALHRRGEPAARNLAFRRQPGGRLRLAENRLPCIAPPQLLLRSCSAACSAMTSFAVFTCA